jgi:predicted nucleotidyltransferase component of viral defense system
MGLLIDRRELLAQSRARNLPLQMIEKDYVLGWVLFGTSQATDLVFKGGTALAKVYFPETWRLSEDLDFVTISGSLDTVGEMVEEALGRAAAASGLELTVVSQHANPGYVQLKVRYAGPLGRNWLKVDVTPESPVAAVQALPLSQIYSDYPQFRVPTESLEEIMAEKLRALVERKKVRDYYDVWRMAQLDLNRAEARVLFHKKLAVKRIASAGTEVIFPPDLAATLAGYWERELGRLVHPVPDLQEVLTDLRHGLGWLEQ